MSKTFQFIKLFKSKEANTNKSNQWPKQDLIKYAVYLNFTENINKNQSEIDYSSWTFFRKLSIFIQSKNPNQCRILHKKMMSDHSSITSLLSELKESIHRFQEWEQHYEPHLMNIKVCLNREKEQSKKQLTSKKTDNYLNTNHSLKKMKQDHAVQSFVKEQKELEPTGLIYQDDKTMKPSTFETSNQKRRPALYIQTQEQSIPNDYLSMINKNTLQGFMELSKEKAIQKSVLEQMVKDCQNSFQSYMSKLSNLSNLSTFMGKFFQND